MRFSLRSPRDRALAIGTAALVLAAVVVIALSRSAPPPVTGVPAVTPTPVATGPTASPTPFVAPQRTEVAIPAEVLEVAPLPSVTIKPPATPTPSPDPAIWRIEGLIVDDKGEPITEACVSVGRRGCLAFSPRTDDRGVFYFEVPPITTIEYDLYFFKEGYRVAHLRFRPTSAAAFGVALSRP